jgi:hypothetical protein
MISLQPSFFRILSQSIASSQTPNKSRPAKYDYCSPVKSVRKPAAPAPIQASTAEHDRKPKKKMKLFPAGGGSKTHKSFSDVEERLVGPFSASSLAATSAAAAASQYTEGVFELPVTPVRSKRPSGEDQHQKAKRAPAGRMTPSPQTFNLGDFLVKSDVRKGRTGTPKSPGKVPVLSSDVYFSTFGTDFFSLYHLEMFEMLVVVYNRLKMHVGPC